MPGAAALPGQVADFATNWMQTPNRYLSELATSTRTAGDARLRQGQTEGLRGIEEWAASRGLTGSSYEGDQVVNLTDKQGMARAEQERSLLEMMAGAETQDRQAAGQYGINAATLGDTVGLDRYKALMDAYGIESGVGLEAASLAQDKEQFTASLGQNATQFDKQMSEQQAGRMQQYGISTGELDLKAKALQQQATTEGRTLDLQSARDQAEVDYRAAALQQQAQAEGRSMSLEEAKLAATKEQFTSQLGQNASQFDRQMAEEQASRAQTLGLSTQDLNLRAKELQQNASSEDRALTLQDWRARAEIDLQTQTLQQDAKTQNVTLTQQAARDLATQQIARAGLDEQRASRLQSLGLDQQGIDLRVQELQQQATQEGGRLGLAQAQHDSEVEFRTAQIRQQDTSLSQQEARDQAEVGFRDAQIDEQRASRLQQLGLSTNELELKATEVQNSYELQGKSLTMQEARDQAEIDYRAEKIGQENRAMTQQAAMDAAQLEFQGSQLNQQRVLANREMDDRASQFAESIGMSKLQFAQQQSEFSSRMAEETAGRLQQANQFASSLSETNAARVIDDTLRGRALDIQETGVDAEAAYKEASIALEREIKTEANRLTGLGITNEDAWRTAALTQDEKFRQLTIDFQNAGLTLQESLAQAEQTWRSSESEEQRKHEIKMSEVDQKRLLQMLASLGITVDAAAVTAAGSKKDPEDPGANPVI